MSLWLPFKTSNSGCPRKNRKKCLGLKGGWAARVLKKNTTQVAPGLMGCLPGLIVMTAELEAAGKSLFVNEVPEMSETQTARLSDRSHNCLLTG